MFWRKRSAAITPELTAAMRGWLLELGVEGADLARARHVHNVVKSVYPGGLTGFYTDYIYARR